MVCPDAGYSIYSFSVLAVQSGGRILDLADNLTPVFVDPIDLTPRKPFMRFYHNITIGMQVDQVQSLFNQHFPPDGKFRQPTWGFGDGSPVTPNDNDPHLADRPNQSLHYTLDPNDGRFNSEWLVVYFKDGQVVGAEYLPD
jgi:hypothetical protein